MIVCVAITPSGLVAGGWGRADRVAIAQVANAEVSGWQEFEVSWGQLHDSGPEGTHHARIARFLREHGVEAVVAGHMGAPMQNMLRKMGVETSLGATGSAREAASSLSRRRDSK